MKKPLLIVALLLVASLAAQAQGRPGASFGIKAGASLTSLTNRNLESSRYLWGFHAGITGRFAVSERLAIQPEVLYSQKGVRDKITAFGVGYEGRLRLHYLDVPVLARLGAGGWFVELGPQLGFAVAAASREVLVGAGGGVIDQDVKSQIRTVEVGYAGGLGYQPAGGPGVGLRYNGGLLDINQRSLASTSVRNSAFQLYVSYVFGKS